jgi:PAS domain S-box-containing protein
VAIALSTVPDGRFIDVNDSFLRMFDFSRESVVNRTAGELGIWENPEDIECVNEILKKQRSICGMECKFRTRSGASRMALVFIERIELSSSPCAIFITHDITDRLGLETQLRKAQKLEAVGQLAAGVAHDFNNLLTVIQGHAELAMMEDNLPAALIKSLETVSTTSRRAANLTRQLLTFSRQQSLQPKPLNLNEVLNDLLKMVKHLLTNDVGLKTNYAAHLPVMRADLTMIEQVVMNLAVNARDAMPQGGTLLIETQSVEIDEAYVQKRAEARPGHFVCLTVRDTGCGMDLATQARIFEPFFTTKEVGKGTGLGLATVYGIVKQHKGWLELTSEVGQGTTFKIFFPGEEAVPGAKAKTAGRDARPGPATVLVVEDEAAVCELVRTILQSAGFRVLHASNAMEAMQLWNEHRGEVDLVFTDMVMPRGMSGRELAANLLALKPDLKIVYTTGYSRDVIGHDLELQEGHNFLPKPHAPPKLIEMIRTRLNSHEPARLEA